ncbi:MAG TPA: hypothetical protein VE998_01215, partial [Terriglobales bacterium]|nr:hypothetical protein [Terriglobales bacterium]
QTINELPVYTITSMAMTSTGAKRITQEEVANIVVPPLPGALTLDGPAPTVGTPHSANYGITGMNANSCNQNPAAANLPAIGTVNSTDATNVGNSLFRPANYTGVDGTNPDVSNVSSKLAGWKTVGELEQVVTEITAMADGCTGSPCPSGVPAAGSETNGWGTSANPTINVVNGDATNCTGAGIMVVTGALTCSGTYSWTGVILVIGKGYVTSNGGGSGSITGGVLVANLYDHTCGASDASCNSQHALSASATPGTPTFNWSGGGGNGITYDACKMPKFNNKFGLRTLVTREEMY